MQALKELDVKDLRAVVMVGDRFIIVKDITDFIVNVIRQQRHSLLLALKQANKRRESRLREVHA